MVANVQCPVCTLFLHAGMNLSDHLETHPKEQVIKALVQMTITGGGGLSADSALKAALLGADANKSEKQEPSCSAATAAAASATTLLTKPENDVSRSNSRMSTISSSSASCSTTSSSLNFSNNNFGTTETTAAAATVESNLTILHQQEDLSRKSNFKQSYLLNRSNLGTNEAAAANATTISEAFNAMHFNRFQQQQMSTSEQKNAATHVAQLTNQGQLKNVHQKAQSTTFSKQILFGNATQHQQQQQQQQLPPPPPPMPTNHQQVKEQPAPTDMSANAFTTLSAQQHQQQQQQQLAVAAVRQ